MPTEHPAPVPDSSVWVGRSILILAAVLWSLSGLFTRLLQTPTILGIHEPALTPLQIAFYRALFAGLFFIPFLRRRDISYQPLMLWMVLSFAVMNWLFLTALARGSAANAILLQYTAPVWIYLLSVFGLGERADSQSLRVIQICTLGLAVIVGGAWMQGGVDDGLIVAMATGSGFTYGIVLLCLRQMRGESSAWLVTLNHLGAVVCLFPFIMHLPLPTVNQLLFMSVFGVVQMGLPYWMMARGLKSVSPQEAGVITLLEPMLNPLWAYLLVPEKETPPITTWIGGALILGALAWRYWPRKRVAKGDAVV